MITVSHLTCYYDCDKVPAPYCVDIDCPDNEDGTRSGGNVGHRFSTPEDAGKFVKNWLEGYTEGEKVE